MAINTTRLSFDVLPSTNCKLLYLIDNSFYADNITVTGNTLQIISPFSEDVIELSYKQNGVTVLNSNNLNITNVGDLQYLDELPDGAYYAKISICPYDSFWYEKTWYRTCKIECKWHKALLNLDVNTCEECFNKSKQDKLMKAWVYIEAVKANADNNDFVKATSLYEKADKILTDILNCEC
tara:strand:+ start:15112 stop:15654 length:543 start_codon:yes stop_codon:yes gene_type:complete